MLSRTPMLPAGWPLRRGAIAGLVLVIGAIGLGSSRVPGSLAVIAVTGASTQVALGWLVIRGSPHRLSLTSAFALAWLVMFTVRLAQITVAPDPHYHHPVIIAATESAKAQMWILTTIGFAAFWVGVRMARSLVRPSRLPETDLPSHALVVLFYVFVGISYALALSGVESGLLQNLAQFYLFIVAYASYRSADAQRSIGLELPVVLVVSSLSVLFGYKEFAILPVLSWMIGQWAARRRIVSPGAVAVVLIGAFFYLGIQAQRSAVVLGEDTSFVPALTKGITEYDLASGTYRHKEGPAIVANAFAAVASRLAGVDALFAVKARVPEVVPFQAGRSIWQPALSTLPGTSSLIAPDFSQLSLGRYYAIRFWSLRPDQDTSNQSLTITGDFYLNFGAVGVVVGLLAFGALYAGIDRRAPVSSATAAGLFAYAALPILTIDRNVAYVLVTGAIRYTIGLIFVGALARWSAGRTAPLPAEPGAAPCVAAGG